MTQPDPRHLRVSDAEREHVASLLQKAVGLGLLTLDELADRTDVALAARTRGELNVVLADLPGLVHQPDSAPAADRLELKATLSQTTRRGDWLVPKEIAIRSKMGSTELDFTEARFSSRSVRIDLDVSGGSVELLVPSTASVSTTDVHAIAGSVEDHSGGAGRPDGVRFVLAGTLRMGSLEIRKPRYYRAGRLQVRWPPQVRWDPR
ncbi:DUF1707 SHOCT-like domain-containing protein [Amycolatopsis minnesotensis]|uniref:DUF1707 domain-containing protein n=1 Tax=Amycolatopsis minnesotensis TaxID=337894 RepID=A0ABP5CWV1_9PSEU